MSEHPSGEREFEFRLAPELEAGVYANFLSVWHTPHEFTLDFGAIQPAEPDEEEELKTPCRVVSRVKVPVPWYLRCSSRSTRDIVDASWCV
jgi:hypothetical protein